MGLKDTWNRWIKNKTVIDFNVKMINGVLSVSGPKKYLKAIQELSDQMLQEAVSEIGDRLQFPIDPHGHEEIDATVKKFLITEMDELVEVLLSCGYDAFDTALNQDLAVLRLRYELNRLQKGPRASWVRWDGSMLTSEGWMKADGSVKQDTVANAINAFLSNHSENEQQSEETAC